MLNFKARIAVPKTTTAIRKSDKKNYAPHESVKKSLVKTISWRIIGTLDTILISWLITGTFVFAISIGMIELFTKMVLYLSLIHI